MRFKFVFCEVQVKLGKERKKVYIYDICYQKINSRISNIVLYIHRDIAFLYIVLLKQ